MLEMLLQRKGGGVFGPPPPLPSNLGPGPTTLIGWNATEGFFGETTTAALITGPALATLVGLTTGTAINPAEPWLKFVIDGKIVYYAKKSFRHSVTWSTLSTKGIVNDTQTLSIAGSTFKIGLPKGLNPDTAVPYTVGVDTKSTWNSEWNRLMYPITVNNTTYPKTSQVDPNWVTYIEADLGLATGWGRYSLCREAIPSSNTNAIGRGYYGVAYIAHMGKSSYSADFGWRPRLELVQ